jgi:nicotinate-nucleotide adenylyltransferase
LRLGVLGGTFDPVHYAHLRLGEAARVGDVLSLDKVLFVPAGRPWRKSDRVVSDARHRAAMLSLAIEGNNAFEISTLEMEREGPSYMVDTLELLRERYPNGDLFLIMGEDALADLPNWHEPERILALARLVVAARHDDTPDPFNRRSSLPPDALESMVSLPMESLEISGSSIRDKVRRGVSIRYLVPEGVRLYIEEHRLYRE